MPRRARLTYAGCALHLIRAATNGRYALGAFSAKSPLRPDAELGAASPAAPPKTPPTTGATVSCDEAHERGRKREENVVCPHFSPPFFRFFPTLPLVGLHQGMASNYYCKK
jgi:hypothetical protein